MEGWVVVMSAGELNCRITFQKTVTTYNNYHEPLETWVDDVTVWASVLMSGSREFHSVQKTFAEATATVKIRYRTDITALHRIKFGDRYFAILGSPIDVDNKHAEMLIAVKEVV